MIKNYPAPSNELTNKAFFISPMVNLEKLICDMMMWAGISEETLREKKEIATDFGETLSWEYRTDGIFRPLNYRY